MQWVYIPAESFQHHLDPLFAADVHKLSPSPAYGVEPGNPIPGNEKDLK